MQRYNYLSLENNNNKKKNLPRSSTQVTLWQKLYLSGGENCIAADNNFNGQRIFLLRRSSLTYTRTHTFYTRSLWQRDCQYSSDFEKINFNFVLSPNSFKMTAKRFLRRHKDTTTRRRDKNKKERGWGEGGAAGGDEKRKTNQKWESRWISDDLLSRTKKVEFETQMKESCEITRFTVKNP